MTRPFVVYFLELCTYIIQMFQTNRYPRVHSKVICLLQNFKERIRLYVKSANVTKHNVDKTLKHWSVGEHFCLSHNRQIVTSNGGCLKRILVGNTQKITTTINRMWGNNSFDVMTSLYSVAAILLKLALHSHLSKLSE